MNTKPLISLGMPIYNAERYLAGAIEAILNQTFQDWELLISDNASTDATPEICRDFAGRDSRIRIVRQDRNVGAGRNHNITAQLASAGYFKWYSHDDLIAPDFLRQAKAVLDADPSVVLCHSRVRVIDEHGNPLEDFRLSLRTGSPDAVTRFRDMVIYNHPCYQIYGLMRLNVLRDCGFLGLYVNGDRVLLARLALLGRYHELPEFLSLNRRHQAQSTQKKPDGIRHRFSLISPRFRTLPRLEWWDPDRKDDLDIPELTLFNEYLRCIAASPLSASDKWRCVSTLIPTALKRSPRLAHDLLDAGTHLTTAARSRFKHYENPSLRTRL